VVQFTEISWDKKSHASEPQNVNICPQGVDVDEA
jgi:hypothetical protein